MCETVIFSTRSNGLASVDGHVVVSEQNLLSDSINNAVRHGRSLSENFRVGLKTLRTVQVFLCRSWSRQEAFDFAHHADDFRLVREGDHEELVALVETDHAVRK